MIRTPLRVHHERRSVFHALRHRNFRLFFVGQLLSLTGSWMQIVAGSWLVYRLTNSAFYVGCAAFALNIPGLFLSPFAGIAADRFDKRRLLMLVNVLSLLQAVTLGMLIVTGTVEVWHVMALSLVLGALNSFELPVRQSFLHEMIEDRKDLPNAIALNSTMFNSSRLIGPAVAGFLIASWGEAACFFINAASFLPVLAAFLMMDLPPHRYLASAHSALKDFHDGVVYAYWSLPIRMLLWLLAAISILGGFFYALAPVFAEEVFHGGPKTLGFMMMFSGAGALLGSIYLAGRQTVIGLGRIIGFSAVGAGVSMTCLAMSQSTASAYIATFASGVFMIFTIGGTNIILQTVTDEDKRGRVMSLYGMALIGLGPIGSLAAGAIAAKWGIVVSLFIAGVAAIGAAAVFIWRLPRFRANVRPIYVRKGIITAV